MGKWETCFLVFYFSTVSSPGLWECRNLAGSASEAGAKEHAVPVGVYLRGRKSTHMAEKREKKEKKDTPTAISESPVAAAPAEKKNTPPKPRIPQLAKRNKSRLPRRQKKALQKAADR